MEVLGNEDSALMCVLLNNKNQQLMAICVITQGQFFNLFLFFDCPHVTKGKILHQHNKEQNCSGKSPGLNDTKQHLEVLTCIGS